MKKVSRIEYCASFEPLQSGMGQDGESKILCWAMKHITDSYVQQPATKSVPVSVKTLGKWVVNKTVYNFRGQCWSEMNPKS